MDIVGIIIFVVIAFVVQAAVREGSFGISSVFTAANESLCHGCVHAHIARGCNAKHELMYCTYGGVSREVNFAVSDCTMFYTRYAEAPIVRVIGFAETVNDSVTPQVTAIAGTE